MFDEADCDRSMFVKGVIIPPTIMFRDSPAAKDLGFEVISTNRKNLYGMVLFWEVENFRESVPSPNSHSCSLRTYGSRPALDSPRARTMYVGFC